MKSKTNRKSVKERKIYVDDNFTKIKSQKQKYMRVRAQKDRKTNY